MSKLITPQDAVTIVLEQKTTDFSVKFFDTRLQKVSFLGSIASTALGIVLGAIFRATRLEWIGWGALGCITASSLLALLYQAAQITPDLRKLRNPERQSSGPLAKAFNGDMDLIHKLAADFEAHHLSYAKAMYTQMAKHLRERIGLIVGALDKVGVIPLAITGYLSYAKAISDGINFGSYEWLAISFVGLYLFAIRLSSTAQWMEHVAEIYAHAHTLKMHRK
jgi:hypothetical protein